jgi:hypothetical protein
MAYDELWDRIRAAIAKHGQCVQVVQLTKADPPGTQPFMYTIGNHQRGLPELLLIGTDNNAFADVLNRLGKIQVERGRGFADEELVGVGGKFPLRLVEGGELGRKKYASFVGIYYKAPYFELRQVLLPDTKGRFPDDPGCDAPYRNQPILSAIERTRE